MYKEYFGLKESPFSIAPNPRYLYMSEQHREALAHLLYGFNSDGGFVLLTGEVGTGKTTVCRCLLDQIPENTVTAFIINPKLTVEELLATICDEFGINYQEGSRSTKYYVDLINRYLLEAREKGKRAVLIIDEAQNLSSDVLEQLRLLTNLETNQVKLLQIILLGQPELRDKLSRPELRQLSQRIIARYHLGPLSKRDVAFYVTHRLTVAGANNQFFTKSAIDKLYRLSGGIPRLINVLCDRALLGAFVYDKKQVTRSILMKASREVFGGTGISPHLKKIYAWTFAFLMVVIIGVVFAAGYYHINGISEFQVAEPKTGPQSSLPNSMIQHEEVSEPIFAAVNSEQEGEEELQRPAGLTLEQSRLTAFQSLFKSWGLTYDPQSHQNACDYAKVHGLQCYYERGDLQSLIVLNHAAVLQLVDNHGRKFYTTLTGIEGNNATLVIGEESKKYSLNVIESHWFGDCILLWQSPPQYQGEIRPGEQSVLVPWLHEQLAFIQKIPYTPRTDMVYDEKLVRRVKEFQKLSSLSPDGIIGPRTLMGINASGGGDLPLLMKKEKVRRD